MATTNEILCYYVDASKAEGYDLKHVFADQCTELSDARDVIFMRHRRPNTGQGQAWFNDDYDINAWECVHVGEAVGPQNSAKITTCRDTTGPSGTAAQEFHFPFSGGSPSAKTIPSNLVQTAVGGTGARLYFAEDADLLAAAKADADQRGALTA